MKIKVTWEEVHTYSKMVEVEENHSYKDVQDAIGVSWPDPVAYEPVRIIRTEEVV